MGVIASSLNLLPKRARLDVIRRFERHVRRQRLSECNAIAREVTGGRVVNGPFSGMQLPDAVGWPRYHQAPKLFGTFECELAEYIERMVARQPSSSGVAGSAEGYYTVGLRMLLPSTPIIAFDIQEQCRRDTLTTAAANGVDIDIRGECTPTTLNATLTQGAAVVMDIEGAEAELLDSAKVPALISADIIVESHDRESITPLLAERFAESHDVTVIEESSRPNLPHPDLAHLPSAARSIAVCELRGRSMQWLYLEALTRA